MFKNRRALSGHHGAVAALIASGIFWGTSVPLSKLALGWLGPGWLTVARFGLAAVLLVLVAARPRPGGQGAGGLRGAVTLPVLASGMIGYGLSVVVQNVGLARTSVTHASLIIGATPILVAIIVALWHRAVARPVAWAGFALSLGGVAMIAGGQGNGATAAGDALVLIAVLLSASVTVAQGRLLEGRDPIALTAVQFLGAALAALPFAAAEGLPAAHPAPVAVLAVLGLTICGTMVPFSLFALGQKKVSAELAGAFLNLEPLVGAMVGIAAFGDPAGPRQLGGGTAILIGIALSSLPLLAARGRAISPPGAPGSAVVAAPVERAVAGVARMADMSGVARVSGVSRMADMSGVARVADVSRVSGVAGMAVVARVAAVAGIAGAAPVADRATEAKLPLVGDAARASATIARLPWRWPESALLAGPALPGEAVQPELAESMARAA